MSKKEVRPLEAILASMESSRRESPGEERVHEWLDAKQVELIAALEVGLQGLKDYEAIKQAHAEDMVVYRMAGGANAYAGSYPALRVPSNLRRLTELADDLAAVISTRINGRPKTTACICPKPKCKTITMRGVDGVFRCRGCGNEYTVLGGRWTRGLGLGFWGRYCFGDKFGGLLESDAQEELVDRNNS